MLDQKNWEPEFAARFARHYDEMKWLYGELVAQRSQVLLDQMPVEAVSGHMRPSPSRLYRGFWRCRG